MKKRLLALLMCVTLVLALAACAGGSGDEKGFTFKVIHGDGTETSFDVTTKKDTVGEALVDEGLITGEVGAYGLYVKTVDKETVDESKDQWWCLTKDGGQQVNTGVDSTPVEDGATFEFTLTEGY